MKTDSFSMLDNVRLKLDNSELFSWKFWNNIGKMMNKSQSQRKKKTKKKGNYLRCCPTWEASSKNPESLDLCLSLALSLSLSPLPSLRFLSFSLQKQMVIYGNVIMYKRMKIDSYWALHEAPINRPTVSGSESEPNLLLLRFLLEINATVRLSCAVNLVNLLDIDDFHATVDRLPNLDGELLGDELSAHADLPFFLVYHVALEFFSPIIPQRKNTVNAPTQIPLSLIEWVVTSALEENSPDLSVAAIAVDAHPHHHAEELQRWLGYRRLARNMKNKKRRETLWGMMGEDGEWRKFDGLVGRP